MSSSSNDSLSFEISVAFLSTKIWDIQLMDPLSTLFLYYPLLVKKAVAV